MQKVKIKTDQEMEIMYEGGQKLAKIKKRLKKEIKVGVTAAEIENLAKKFIKEEKAEASFKKVPGYKWATCVNVNDGVVHGIPKKEILFKDGDLVSVDLGIYYKGFHTDSAISVLLGKNKEIETFLSIGAASLNDGIRQVKEGKKIQDISRAIEDRLKKSNLRPIWSLTGHGVGRQLHEYPYIPCFVSDTAGQDIVLKRGFVLAVEVMYTQGNGDVVVDRDGWTIRTKDGKISALFEETVAITGHGPVVLTV